MSTVEWKAKGKCKYQLMSAKKWVTGTGKVNAPALRKSPKTRFQWPCAAISCCCCCCCFFLYFYFFFAFSFCGSIIIIILFLPSLLFRYGLSGRIEARVKIYLSTYSLISLKRVDRTKNNLFTKIRPAVEYIDKGTAAAATTTTTTRRRQRGRKKVATSSTSLAKWILEVIRYFGGREE